VETGNKAPSLSSIFKQEFHLKPDNQGELQASGLRSFVGVSRSRIQLLKIDASLKAIEIISFVFPYTKNDERWLQRVEELVNSTEFTAFTNGTEIRFSVSDSRVSIVPQPIYSEEKKEALFSFAEQISNNAIVLKQELPELDAVGLFSVPQNLNKILPFPLVNSHLLWIRNVVKINRKITANLIINNEDLSLVVSKNHHLLFSNRFDISAPQDVLYFLMATLEALKILHTKVSVVLYGNVKKKDATHEILEKYLSDISFASQSAGMKCAYSFKEISAHHFPHIFQAACE